MYVDIELDEGTVKCSIVTIFEVEGKDYIVQDGDIMLFRFAT
mgnify:CR=1 FL=1